MEFRHRSIKRLLSILSFLIYGLYNSGAISNSTPTKAPLTLIVTMSSSLSTFLDEGVCNVNASNISELLYVYDTGP